MFAGTKAGTGVEGGAVHLYFRAKTGLPCCHRVGIIFGGGGMWGGPVGTLVSKTGGKEKAALRCGLT